MLEWVVISSSRGSSPPKDRNRISYVSCIRILATESLLLLLLSPLLAGGFFTSSTTWEAHMRLYAIFIFLFLTSFCVKGSRFTHLSSIGSLPPFLEGGVREGWRQGSLWSWWGQTHLWKTGWELGRTAGCFRTEHAPMQTGWPSQNSWGLCGELVRHLDLLAADASSANTTPTT